MRNILIAATAVLIASPAFADEREYCPERPGLGTPACTIVPGRVSVETGLGDWTLEQDSEERTDTVLIGDTLVRVGLTDAIEAQVGWTPYGHVRTRDKASGAIESAGRVGDITVAAKFNLHDADGKGLSAAIRPFVTVPVGRAPVGDGDWGAGLVVPVTYDLSDTLNLQSTAEFDAAVNEGGHGQHFAASETVGLGIALTKNLTGTIEAQVLRDDAPEDKTTQALAALSLGWMASDSLQLDIGGAAGLNRDAPDAEVYVGIARRF